jgi:hypothetical protein
MHDLWTELRDPVATLHEAARLLRQDGRLEIVERRSRIELRELVRLLENNGWDVHSSTNLGEDGYRLVAAVCDESVTS